MTTASAERLKALAQNVADDLRRLGEPAAPWTSARADRDADVLIVGAGQCGLAAAFGLKRAGVGRVRTVSRDAEGREGSWRTFARMPTLRSPKAAPGPELGLPSLAYESWHVARYGRDHYAALDLIATEDWAAYIDWFRRTAGIAVEQNRRLVGLDGYGDDAIAADFADGGRIVVRQVILATGMDALGAPTLPPPFDRLPARLCHSCYGDIDFAAFEGKRIAVIGAASTAFDNAAEALEAGAAAVDLFCREARLRTINYMKGVADYGAVAHWADFDDATRWRFALHGTTRSAPPIAPTVERACRWDNFHILLSAPVGSASVCAGRVVLGVHGGERAYDVVLMATGYGLDPAAKPELAQVTAAMARWSDRFAPPPGQESAALGAYPYLTPGFAFTARKPGAAPWLERIRLFAGPAVVSMGRITGESGNLKYGVPRLTSAVTRALALEDSADLFARSAAYAVPETCYADYAANAVQPPTKS